MKQKLEIVKCGEADVSYYGLTDRFTIEQFKNTSIEKLIVSVLEKSDIITSKLNIYEVLDIVPEKSDVIPSKFYPSFLYDKNEREKEFTVLCNPVETYENGIIIYLKYPKKLRYISGYDCTYSSAALIIGPEETSFIITDFGIRDLPAYWKNGKIYDVFGEEIDDDSKMELNKALVINRDVMNQKVKKLGKKFDTEIFYEDLRYWGYTDPDATEKTWIEYSMLDKLIHKRNEKKQLGYILNARRAALNNLIPKILVGNTNQKIENTKKRVRAR